MDLALINGKIATMIAEDDFIEAVGISGNKIAYIGTTEEIMNHTSESTKIIDMGNRLVVPGFNDSHIHLLNYGYTKSMVPLGNCASMDELIEAASTFKNEKCIKDGEWIVGRGWNQDYLKEKRFPTRKDLDKISTDHPVCFIRACGHIAMGNSMAVEMVKNKGLEIRNADLDTGYFYEDGCDLIYDVIGAPDIDEIKDMIVSAATDFSNGGITSVQSDDLATLPDNDFKKVIQAYEELNKEGKLPVRVYQQSLLPEMKRLKEFVDLGYKTGYGDQFFKIGPLKLLLDGSLGARTALVYDGYQDKKGIGVAVYTNEELFELVEFAIKSDMQVAIHAIGDKAIDICVDTIIKAKGDAKDPRHGIVHCQITTDAIIDKMKQHNIIAYIQPIFIDYDMHIVEDRIGTERAEKTYSWKTLDAQGIPTCGGSDCPVVDFNILENIYTAVTRKDLKGYPENGWLPNERLSVYQALELFTSKGAYASFEEEIKGRIQKGMLADLAVLSKDIFTINEEDIKEVTIDMTVLDGRVVKNSID